MPKGWMRQSSPRGSLPGYGSVRSAWSNGWAPVAGKVKPRTELIFPFRNSFSCPGLVLETPDAREKGKSGQARALLCFHHQLLGWFGFPLGRVLARSQKPLHFNYWPHGTLTEELVFLRGGGAGCHMPGHHPALGSTTAAPLVSPWHVTTCTPSPAG